MKLKFTLLCWIILSIWGLTEAESEKITSPKKSLIKFAAEVDNEQVILTFYRSWEYRKAEHDNLFKTFRVYRLICSDFEFGKDYEEYFDGLDYKTAQLVFPGPIKSIKGLRQFVFIDTDVQIGTVYAYWIAASEGEPIGPRAVKPRDPEIWWSYAKLNDQMARLKKSYPDDVKVEIIGRSVRGREIKGIRIGKAKRCIGLMGAIHAGESGPELMIPVFEMLLEKHRDLLDKISIVAIPVVNADMREAQTRGVPWYLRKNANSVDLFPNFPTAWDEIDFMYGISTADPYSGTYRGPFPASEPETRAVMNFIQKHRPEVMFSFHWLASICGSRLLATRFCVDDKEFVRRCENYAHAFWKGIDPDLPKKMSIRFSCTPGCMATWCYKELNTPGFA